MRCGKARGANLRLRGQRCRNEETGLCEYANPAQVRKERPLRSIRPEGRRAPVAQRARKECLHRPRMCQNTHGKMAREKPGKRWFVHGSRIGEPPQ
jgi:hypothetical protein